jgi:hypothetical protein
MSLICWKRGTKPEQLRKQFASGRILVENEQSPSSRSEAPVRGLGKVVPGPSCGTARIHVHRRSSDSDEWLESGADHQHVGFAVLEALSVGFMITWSIVGD